MENNDRNLTFSLPEELYEELEKIKEEDYKDKTQEEMLKILIEKGVERVKSTRK